jgi:hypothetical protein
MHFKAKMRHRLYGRQRDSGGCVVGELTIGMRRVCEFPLSEAGGVDDEGRGFQVR